jgi:hypothetical protein
LRNTRARLVFPVTTGVRHKGGIMRLGIFIICLLLAHNSSYAADITYEFGILKLENLTKAVSDQYEKGYISHSVNPVIIEKTNQIIAKPNLAFGIIVKTSKKIKIQAKWLYPSINKKTNQKIQKSYLYEARQIDDSIFYYWLFEKPDGENNPPNEGKHILEVSIDDTKEFRSFDFYVTNQ